METLRQFADDQSGAAAGGSKLRAPHAAYFVSLAERARAQQSTSDAAGAATVLAQEWHNLRSALDWLVLSDDRDQALTLLAAVFWFGWMTLRYELAGWAEHYAGLPAADDHPRGPQALGIAALLRWSVADHSGAEELATRATNAEARQGLSPCLEAPLALTCTSWSARDSVAARRWLGACEQVAHDSQDPIEVGVARYCRVIIEAARVPERAMELAREFVREAEPGRNPYQLSYAHAGLLSAARATQDMATATSAYSATKKWADQVDNRLVLAQATAFLARTAADADPAEALEWLREAIIELTRSGDWGHGQWVLKSCLLPLIRMGRHRNAARALGAIDWLFPDQRRQGDVVSATHRVLADALGPAEFDALLDSGRQLDRSELVRLVLDEIASCREPDETNL
jgi:hypothetical protein